MMAAPGMRARPFGRESSYGGVLHTRLRGWWPVHAWSGRRRALVAAVLGVFAMCLVSGACVVLEVGGAQAAQSALADAHARLASARQTLVRLPALQRETHEGQDGQQRGREGSAAGDIRGISRLAAQAGLVLIALEPAAASGGALAPAFRTTKLVALGSFEQLSTFLEGLATLPELVVPAEFSVRRSAGSLAVSALLQVFDGLPAGGLARSGNEGGPLADPFASGFSGVQGAAGMQGVQGNAAMRLSGMLVERGRAVALVETAEGTVAVQTGATLAGARVSSVDPVRIVLSLDGATHTLGWAEDAK
ncbi:Pilus assembly protein [Paraburkholderia sacchari]